MASKRRLLLAPALTIAALLSPGIARAAPVDKVRDCSRVEYRQEHLKECNLQQSPFLLGGDDGPCGLICHIGGLLGGIF